MPLIHHIHFYVPDAMASQAWFCHAMGMRMVRSVESDDRITCLLSYQSTWFLLSSPTSPHSPIARYLNDHAPGIADIALLVDQLSDVLGRAPGHRQETSPDPPEALCQLDELLDDSPDARWGWLPGWGSVNHTLVQSPRMAGRSPGHHRSVIDHVVLNVPFGELNAVVAYYVHLFGFERKQNFQIQTDRSGLSSQVLMDPGGDLYLNINEPSCDRSQIQEFITVHRGAGIQHLALRSEPLLETVKLLRQQGLPLLPAPPTYYQALRDRLSQAPELAWPDAELQGLIENHILMDWQPGLQESVLLQIFSLPILPDSLFFFEFIERCGKQAKGFGERNFQALYDAVEAELQSP